MLASLFMQRIFSSFIHARETASRLTANRLLTFSLFFRHYRCQPARVSECSNDAVAQPGVIPEDSATTPRNPGSSATRKPSRSRPSHAFGGRSRSGNPRSARAPVPAISRRRRTRPCCRRRSYGISRQGTSIGEGLPVHACLMASRLPFTIPATE